MTTSLGSVETIESKQTIVTPNTENDGFSLVEAGKTLVSGLGWLATGFKNIGSVVGLVPSWLIYQGAKLTGNYDVALQWTDAAWIKSEQTKKALIFADFAQKNKSRLTQEELSQTEKFINNASISELVNGGNYDMSAVQEYIDKQKVTTPDSGLYIHNNNSNLTPVSYVHGSTPSPKIISTPLLPLQEQSRFVSTLQKAVNAAKGGYITSDDKSLPDLAGLLKEVNNKTSITHSDLSSYDQRLDEIAKKVSSYTDLTGPSGEIASTKLLIKDLISPSDTGFTMAEKK